MVQRYRIRGFLAIRLHDNGGFSSLWSPALARRVRQLHFLSVRGDRYGSNAIAVVQCCLRRRVLAVLHRNRCSANCRHVPVCADDSGAA
jgi:hypothetical protein